MARRPLCYYDTAIWLKRLLLSSSCPFCVERERENKDEVQRGEAFWLLSATTEKHVGGLGVPSFTPFVCVCVL